MHVDRIIMKSLANSADPGEILHYAAFHLGLHCLPKYLFSGIQNEENVCERMTSCICDLYTISSWESLIISAPSNYSD